MHQEPNRSDLDEIAALLGLEPRTGSHWPEVMTSECPAEAAPSADGGLRRGQQALAEIETLERLIGSLDQTDADVLSIPEHPAVYAVQHGNRLAVEPCVVCACPTARVTADIEGIPEQLAVCEGCGLGSLQPPPEPSRIRAFYPPAYYGTPGAKFEPLVEFGVRMGARLRVRSLVGSLPQGARVLDIGCGRGVMLRALLDLGYEAHGVEISREAAAGTDPRATIHIAPDIADANLPDGSFDAVIMWHVLEHLPNPDRTLIELRRILKPGGRLILAVPNFASWQSRCTGHHWFHLDLPRHLFHFTPQTLRRLLAQHGFECRSTRHFALLQNPFGWLQSILNRMTRTPRNSLYTLLHESGNAPATTPLPRSQRMSLRFAYWYGLPIAALISLLEAAFRRGGTIAVTAELKPDSLSASSSSTRPEMTLAR